MEGQLTSFKDHYSDGSLVRKITGYNRVWLGQGKG